MKTISRKVNITNSYRLVILYVWLLPYCEFVEAYFEKNSAKSQKSSHIATTQHPKDIKINKQHNKTHRFSAELY